MKSLIPRAIRWLPLQYFRSEGRKLFGGPAGGTVVLETAVHRPARAEPFFAGPVCFLIGPGTYSSASDLAAAVKDFHLATLIGEETGGLANSFGEVYPFQLPNSRLGVSVSSAYFVRPSGDGSGTRGVEPDIEVRKSSADVLAGRDPVLDRALDCPARPAPVGR